MSASLIPLLRSVVDYAGLFPPAKLPLDRAIRNYAAYCHDPDVWMLGRFICPTSKLDELYSYIDEMFSDLLPFRISALGRGGDTAQAFQSGFAADLEAICTFLVDHSGPATIDVMETRLPPRVPVAELLQGVDAPLSLFFELPLGPNWRDEVPEACAAIKAAGAGFKLRCGGLEAKAFPSVEQVAFVLRECHRAGVPIKFTAGLHHPIRRFDASVQSQMHGFINVLVAGLLAEQNGDEATIQAILRDENPASFTLDNEFIRWTTHTFPLQRIGPARQRLTSFGSCSFDEPREDLRALGWLS